MANEFIVNLATGGTPANQLQATWFLIMRMLKAGYWMRASSNGTTKVVSDDPTAHTGFIPTNTANSGSAASITAVADHPYGKLMTMTGLTGLLSPNNQGGRSEGNYLTVTGASNANNNGTHQIYEVISSTSAKVLNRSASATAPDANNGAISWQEKDLSTTTYGFTSADQWWACLEGAETYQLQFTTAVTGVFRRGEQISQTGTGATGECVGVVWDTTASLGWMIVSPRTGTFNGTGLLTGSVSAAIVTPTNLYRFRRQWVFAKGNTSDNVTGSSWYGCFRNDTESTNFFSTLASNANCTATVPPGGSPTVGNRLPTSGNVYVIRCDNNDTGTGGSLTHTNGIINEDQSGNQSNGKTQGGVANVMPTPLGVGGRDPRSADGSWWVFIGNTNAPPGNGGNLQAFLRLDGAEEGTPEPHVHFSHGADTTTRTIHSGSRAGGGTNQAFRDLSIGYQGQSTSHYEWLGMIRRAVGSSGGSVAFQTFEQGYTLTSASQNAAGIAMSRNWGATQRMHDHPGTTPPAFKEPLGIRSGFNGRTRWLYLAQIGSAYQTGDSLRYVCISSYDSVNNFPGIFIGPWDQTTTNPTQT